MVDYGQLLCAGLEPLGWLRGRVQHHRSDRRALGQRAKGLGVDVVGRQQCQLGKRGAEQRSGHESATELA